MYVLRSLMTDSALFSCQKPKIAFTITAAKITPVSIHSPRKIVIIPAMTKITISKLWNWRMIIFILEDLEYSLITFGPNILRRDAISSLFRPEREFLSTPKISLASIDQKGSFIISQLIAISFKDTIILLAVLHSAFLWKNRLKKAIILDTVGSGLKHSYYWRVAPNGKAPVLKTGAPQGA